MLLPLPRSRCQRIAISLKGIKKSAVASSIRLQLEYVTGIACVGFAWRSDGDMAEVWYWSESTSPNAEVVAPTNTEPCPEMLLRPALSDGLHLVSCLQGYEALSVAQGRVTRSLWFSQSPRSMEWQRFVQDAGADPALHSLPTAQAYILRKAPTHDWSLNSPSAHLWSHKTWAAFVLVAAVGVVFSVLVGYSLRLNFQIQSLRQDYAALAQTSEATLKLQRELEAQRKPLDAVLSFQPRVLQLRLMARLAEAGLFDEGTKVNLQEWEYRNNRVRIQFAVPPEGFSLSQFLETVENTGLFKDVRLLSGTSQFSVAIQAALADEIESAK